MVDISGYKNEIMLKCDGSDPQVRFAFREFSFLELCLEVPINPSTIFIEREDCDVWKDGLLKGSENFLFFR